MNLKKLALLFILICINIHFSYAQKESIWTEVATGSFTADGDRQIIPQLCKTFRMDVLKLKSILESAPMEFTLDAKTNPVVLILPMSDGSYERFKIVESPMVDEALSDKYPGLRTWSGQGVETPTATAKIDFTKKGFHAMVLSPNGDWFIDPYSSKTIEYYISYFKKDLKSKKMFECGVHSINEPLDKSYKHKKGVNADNVASKNVPNASNNSARFGDCLFRTYRLAVAATGEYTAFHGGTVADGLAAQVTAMNRVNGIYERDFSLRMNLIANNDTIIYTNGATDPYTNGSGGTMLGENQTNLDLVIGTANYDIGHVFSTGGGGIASLNSPCGSNSKARGVTGLGSPIGDPFYIDYVAHEMGHQWGGSHTFNNCNGSGSGSSGVEVGSGVTIQAYAGICGPTNVQSNSDAMFHAYSIEDMYGFITGTGNGCAVSVTTTNNFPTIVSNTNSQTMPHSTPFMLTCVATDLDGDSLLTYSWEQMDSQFTSDPPQSNATGGPNFRTFLPTPNPTRFFPRLQDLVNNNSPTWEVIPTVGRTMAFRLMVRDNNAGAGCNDHSDITLTIAGSSGPFLVMSPNTGSEVWTGFTSETVTWDVASTNLSPVNCPNVDILLSTDGGFTYTDTLATSVANTGSFVVTVPNVSTTNARIMVVGNGRAFFDISNNDFSIIQGSLTLSCVVSSMDALCNGGNDGNVSVQALGGTAPYTYLWNDGSTDASILNVSAGTYTVTVSDGAAANTTCMISVNEPALIQIFSTATDATCGGYSDGTASVTVIGGTQINSLTTDTLFEESFEDSLANGFTQQTNATDGGWIIGSSSDISSGNWTVPSHTLVAATNDDACDCDKADEFFILPAQNFSSNLTITLEASVYFEGNTYQGDLETASIEASTDNGLTWDTVNTLNGSTSWQDITINLSAYSGMNNVLIAFKYDDGTGWLYGCAVDDIIILSQPINPIPYTYLWSNGSTDSLASNLTAGIYTVTVTDANGCTLTEEITINEPAPINTTLSKSNVSCFGGSDGTATIAAGGGSSPYSYSWNTVPIQTTAFINNLNGAIYEATVTDAMGCTKTGSVNVRIPDELLAYTIPDHPDSIGANNGSINQLITGGIAPYSHFWSSGETTEDISNKPAGVYLCTTTDRNGCAILTTQALTNPVPFVPIGNISKSLAEIFTGIYPNPATDEINLSFESMIPGQYVISLYNFSGQLLIKSGLEKTTKGYSNVVIDISGFQQGLYLIHVKGKQYSKSFTFSKL